MNQIFQMALKDIKLITRDKLGLFFIVGFPIMMGLFFGSMMNGMFEGGSSGAMRIAVVDQDQSGISKIFVESLKANESLFVDQVEIEEGRASVRKGVRVGLVILPPGFGERAGVFWNEPPDVKIERDPARMAESAMLEGFVMQSIGELVGKRFQDPAQLRPMIEQSKQSLDDSNMNVVQRGLMSSFLSSIDSMLESAENLQSEDADEADEAIANNMQFANITLQDVARIKDQDDLARSGWDISFPQAMLWGMLSCVAGFAISIARERSLGTFVRLQVAPVSRFAVLAGKALACFITAMAVLAMMTGIGMLLGMRPENFSMLLFSSICISFCFVGIMMVISVIGKTEQGVSGAGWGINMVMAMLGGCMIPSMFLPAWIKPFTGVSPVKWAIQALEGSIWRQFTWSEVMLPCGVLIGFGVVGLLVGGFIISRQTD